MRLNVRIAYLGDEVDFGDGAPTTEFRQMAAEYRRSARRRGGALMQTDVAALDRQLSAAGLPPITPGK